MRISTQNTNLITCLILCLSTQISKAQQQNLNLKQDPKFEQLLNEKQKINSSMVANERYNIQIFTGNSEGARSALYSCKQEFPSLPGTIVFNTPNYKVWIGNFRTRIDAERNMMELKKRYPNLVLLKPQN